MDHDANGGRAGESRNKSSIIRRFSLSPAEKADRIAFLRSLTDEELPKDARWSNPWP
jgi:hypothetical protein